MRGDYRIPEEMLPLFRDVLRHIDILHRRTSMEGQFPLLPADQHGLGLTHATLALQEDRKKLETCRDRPGALKELNRALQDKPAKDGEQQIRALIAEVGQ
jgi:hypothetical protein